MLLTEAGGKRRSSAVSKEQIEEAVVRIITENQNDDRETGLGEVGSRLVKLYPDFDVRRYGYSLLSKFLETLPKLKLDQTGTQVTVSLYETGAARRCWKSLSWGRSEAAGNTGYPSVPWATGSACSSGTLK